MPPIILASSSPRRKALLQQIDLEFEVKPATIHEDFSLDLPPEQFATHYARLKAAELAWQYPDHLIIGADTIVVLNNRILGKPQDEVECFTMLSDLSGNTHSVTTGVSLQWAAKAVEDTFHETTQVTFKSISDDDIHYYIRNYRPLDKAGSYGIQDWFAVCIDRVEGCFYNVVGFPLAAFFSHYRQLIAHYGN
ncbi:MAG: septum formation protein Maf [Candidatus Marinimicrobia bacterium]|nr:septum formation protein Maf [Candidatus Neomarinimicrobiota bacterium]